MSVGLSSAPSPQPSPRRGEGVVRREVGSLVFNLTLADLEPFALTEKNAIHENNRAVPQLDPRHRPSSPLPLGEGPGVRVHARDIVGATP